MEQGDKEMNISIASEATILKVDETEGIVYGFAIVCQEDGDDYFDIQGDHIPESVMRKASTEFMKSDRAAKDMHMNDIEGKIVHSMPMTTELADALGMDSIEKTGWIIGMQPNNPEVIAKFASGEYKGFSIGGTGQRDETT